MRLPCMSEGITGGHGPERVSKKGIGPGTGGTRDPVDPTLIRNLIEEKPGNCGRTGNQPTPGREKQK